MEPFWIIFVCILSISVTFLSPQVVNSADPLCPPAGIGSYLHIFTLFMSLHAHWLVG